MRTLRIVGVSFICAAVVMTLAAGEFFRFWTRSTAAHDFIAAVETVSPAMLGTTGMGLVGLVVLSVAALGVGLLLGALIYAPIDRELCRLVVGDPRKVTRAAQGCTPPCEPTDAVA